MGIDASVFSGDLLWDDGQRAMLKDYIGRWTRAIAAHEASEQKDVAPVVPPAPAQPGLTVRLTSFPESNGKRNWTALLVRAEKWDGLIGNCGGITVARGELWNRVAYEAERAKLLIGERDTEPDVLDYGDDVLTPGEWAGEKSGVKVKPPALPAPISRHTPLTTPTWAV